jgi:AcrR family transcriptional regulator
VELIAEKGWEATTAAEIGRRAGYSRAMVHARYGSKDAILDTLFATEYEKKLSLAPDPESSGLQQALAHVDRITELYAEDCDLLRAIFVLTFEAAKATSPAGPRIRMWLERAAHMVERSMISVLPFLAPRTNGSCRRIRTTWPKRWRTSAAASFPTTETSRRSEQARRRPGLGVTLHTKLLVAAMAAAVLACIVGICS